MKGLYIVLAIALVSVAIVGGMYWTKNSQLHETQNALSSAQLESIGICLAILSAIHVWFAICLKRISGEFNDALPQLTFKMFGLGGSIYDVQKPRPYKSWLAWIPIINLYLLHQIAQIPLSWRWIFILTIVSIFISIFLPYEFMATIFWLLLLWFWVWFRISLALGEPWWFGLLMLVPAVNFVIIGILAFSKRRLNTKTS